MADPNRGYALDRFPDFKSNNLRCGICSLVSKEPKECAECGDVYCSYCIDNLATGNKDPTSTCCIKKGNVKPIAGALAKIYRNLDIRCQFTNCQRMVKLCEIAQHEMWCQLPQCELFDLCGNYIKPNSGLSGCCSESCSLMKKIKEAYGNWDTIYEGVKMYLCSSPIAQIGPILKDSSAMTVFTWDTTKMGRNIKISNDKKSLSLNEVPYIFRSVVSDTPMMGGIHYWEIHADPNSENELKIGVTLKNNFNYDTSFSDYEFGYAYYGLGQLRHNNNSGGKPFGKRFRKEGVLGVCLDMNKGRLSFALNGDYWGVAFRSDALKMGPIYAAVSLLHKSGCTLETGKPVPSYFLKE